ncbi:MAG: amidohydrolase family protein, partial [Oligoflexales bacterium]|nr:amidohydrolase family protein [Oligoflexales bacterium]
SFKTFMAYDGMMLQNGQLRKVLKAVSGHGGLVTTHAELGQKIREEIEKLRKAGKLGVSSHPLIHPAQVEIEAARELVQMAESENCPVYIVHISCGETIRLVHRARSDGHLIFGETCPQYLTLDESLYSAGSFEEISKYVMSPPLRSREDRDILWQEIGSGFVDVVATDHCPFTMKQKNLGKDDITKMPNGAPGVEHRMEILFSEGVLKNRISIEQFVAVSSTNPARIFGLYPRKGAIVKGADADLVIWNPNQKKRISAKTHRMNTDISVWENWEVTGGSEIVILRGEVAFENGKVLTREGFGRYLPRLPISDYGSVLAK